MLNESLIKKKFPPVIFNINSERIRLFSKATGETNPVYFNKRIAKSKGYPSLITPPTFLTVVVNEVNYPFKYISDIGIDLNRILHAGQNYRYHHLIYAGDTITMESQIIDIYTKKNRTLQFLEFKSLYTNQNNQLVSESNSTLVARF
tara:strand:- start:556 stop:996 length:441 start_codon:yes stop_codon:yes gene_type:complete